MLTVACIAERVVLTIHGETTRVRGELRLQEAEFLRSELDEFIEILKQKEELNASIQELIEQIGSMNEKVGE